MPGDRFDRERGDAPVEPAWHERTGTLAGASVAALLAIALLYFLISTVARQFDEPDTAPGYYLDPGDTSSRYRTSHRSTTTTTTTTTTTPTTTSPYPPATTDINPTDTSPTSLGPSSTDVTTTDTEPDESYPPRTRDRSTSRSRPRLNQTRTVYPPP